ncbi:ribosomal protection-like ABC-F family protein [Clostridium sp. Marseille-P3244]|uniref:ribosomal protection-like ABC-F family protein n=1 Tax=Clostridium sp. Marseille-P3244 TaxID=1871020 RepID=UPI0009307A7E|nr:ABC-F type ribosomal protection protein [Clostridium sp. Marseille-P3244]
MSLIQIDHLNFTYDGSFDPVFENVTFQIDTDWKLGFIGRNGKGKTTFLKLLMNQYAYSGSITASVEFEYFPFTVKDPGLMTYEILDRVNPVMEQWEVIRELNLLDADPEILYRPFNSLSFGEQTKTLLAALFLKEHAFLLIDEPTNHLDILAREKVADYLSRKKGFILVSHDRDFIDRCVDHVLVLNRRTIEVRKGNFSSWYADKTARDALEQKQNLRLKKDIHKLKESARQAARWSDQVENTKTGTRIAGLRPDRGHIGHQAAKMMKRAKSLEHRREHAVREKETLLKDVESIERLKINVLEYHSRRLISMKDITIDYGSVRSATPLPEHFDLEILKGDRIALSGKNGCGKSSLIRLILGEDVPHTGELYRAGGLKISYISQDTSRLKGDLSSFALQYGIDDALFRTVLKKLGLERVQFEKRIEEYSEGQKKKVLLAGSLCTPAHLFLWDEPLNFIDIFTRIQLEDLILDFQPTMVFVEHDQAFRKKAATREIHLDLRENMQ